MFWNAVAFALILNVKVTDDQARKLAQSYAGKLGISVSIDAKTHLKHIRDRIMVHPGEVIIILDQEGKLVSLSDMAARARLPVQGKPKFRSDGEAWSALEKLLKKVGMPEGVERGPIKLGDTKIQFTMHSKPYGYKALSGNLVNAELHAVTGKVISLHLGRGWKYEKPNIVIKPEDAIKSAVKIYGGKPADWKHVLSYETNPNPEAPFAIRNLNTKKTMRLCYNLSSKFGSVIIDTVTGEVVAKGSPLSPQTATMRRPG